MVYYIRFLKTPKLENGTVRALVTVTTDLGDIFYPGNLILNAIVAENYQHAKPQWESQWHTIQWQNGTRNVWVEIKGIPARKEKHFKLIVSSKPTTKADLLHLNNLPEILSAHSSSFGTENPQAPSQVERHYWTKSGYGMSIREDTGESIACHIWDAGIALVAFVSNVVKERKPTALFTKIKSTTSQYGPRILELGTGCGIVGLEFRYLVRESHVLLTDLPAAMKILNQNAQFVRNMFDKGHLATMEFDWEALSPHTLTKHWTDIILVSDCTYNSDSIPGLVRSLAALMEVSPTALIVVSMKVRHDSEAVFFDLMAGAGLASIEHTAIPLPDRTRTDIGQALEVVDVYVYAMNTAQGE